LSKLRDIVARFGRRLESGGLASLAKDLIQEIGYKAELSRLYPDPNERDARLAGVEEVINSLADYQRTARPPNLREFLDLMALADRDREENKEAALKGNAVALMTLHSAKGLEFPHVYLVGLEEGILPHHRSVGENDAGIEEERRLCYVGVTRAQDELTISLSLTRQKWGKPQDTVPSRFLYELTGQAERAASADKGRRSARRR
jgi:DNA helicase-2/ATP-dependent DNA helicase PcrA